MALSTLPLDLISPEEDSSTIYMYTHFLKYDKVLNQVGLNIYIKMSKSSIVGKLQKHWEAVSNRQILSEISMLQKNKS